MTRLACFLLIIAGLLSTSCDVIDEPLKGGGPNPIDTNSIIQGDSLIQTGRVVLVEDFTGHRCKNCPKAGKAIKALDSLYGLSVVGLAIHAGPSNFTGVTTDYPTDFTTTTGEDLATFFNIFALPLGMVQRMDYPNSQQKSYTAWTSLTAGELALGTEALFQLKASFDSLSDVAVLDVNVSMSQASSHGIALAIYLKESGIIPPQLMPNNTRNLTYRHNNVYRAAPLGTFGKSLSATSVASGDVFTEKVTFTLDPQWDASQCHWVAILYDKDNYKVMQAAELAIRP
ncbi:MAG: Omp28-related outer membrane protein [Bacteroidetes bacterium]|nr:Omp28-related outer membrane protein [Bacteroidota bacterium]